MTLPPGDTCKIWGQIWCHSWGWYWSQRCLAGMLHSPQCTGQHPKRNALSPTLGWRNNWNGEGQGCSEGSGQWEHPGRQGVTSEAASGWHLRGGPSCPGTGTAGGTFEGPVGQRGWLALSEQWGQSGRQVRQPWENHEGPQVDCDVVRAAEEDRCGSGTRPCVHKVAATTGWTTWKVTAVMES